MNTDTVRLEKRRAYAAVWRENNSIDGTLNLMPSVKRHTNLRVVIIYTRKRRAMSVLNLEEQQRLDYSTKKI